MKHLKIIADHVWPVPGKRAFLEVKAGAEGEFLELHARALLAAGAAVEMLPAGSARKDGAAKGAGDGRKG